MVVGPQVDDRLFAAFPPFVTRRRAMTEHQRVIFRLPVERPISSVPEQSGYGDKRRSK
jgi:hypothetical protein